MVWIGCAALTLLLIGVDQWTKWLVVSHMELGENIPFIQGLLSWEYVRNDGAAWGMFGGYRWGLIVFTVILMAVVAAVLFGRQFRKYRLANVVACLILAGGIGNLIDRLLYGTVVDFIHTEFIEFPTFNFADCCVVVGAALMVIFLVFQYREEKPNTSTKEEPADGTENVDRSAGTGGGEA